MTSPQLDPGSFRDREGRVFTLEDRVLRALSPRAFAAWETLAATRFFHRLTEEGKVVATRQVDFPEAELRALSPHWVAVLEHEPIPFVSYPYEWSFSMLRDAAELQLELLLEALEEGLILKDSSAYNVQWQGARPVFIDVASFEKWVEGDPWVGYLQFCQLFLYPLVLTAYRDVSFQPWLRGAIDGISPEECNRLLRLRDRFRPGVFADVYLQAKLQARSARESAASAERSVRAELRQAGFRKEMIAHNVRRLRKIVGKLAWRRSRSEWAEYAEENSYDRENREIKERFVREVAATRHWRLVWDLGSNTGVFSRIAAEHADYVVALDADHLAVDRLYRRLAAEGPGNILPLVGNLADASPALGWRHRERKALSERPRPELTLCLALIHHMVITANIPLPEFVDWLASLGSHLVIEFVTKDDPMVRKLLRNKEDIYHDYEIPVFEACLGEHFEILRQEHLQAGNRKLYFARPLSQ